MVPDLDLQLAVALKALNDTIAPAIDPANKVAGEQLHLVTATLAMVRTRLPQQRRFLRRLLEDAIALAESIDAAAGGGRLGSAIAASRDALADPDMEAFEIEQIRSELTNLIVNMIEEAGAEAPARFGRIILGQSRVPMGRLRAWCLPAGFEPDNGGLPPVEALIQH